MNRRILIVEDDPAIRLLVTTVLEGDGHEVHEVADGLAALPAAQELRPDLVLLDVGLPGLDGFGVLGQLKDDPELRGIPVMMVTAWADPELVAKALDRGAHDYVRKPFDVGDLRERVADALDDTTGLPGHAALAEQLERRAAAGHGFAVMLVGLDVDAADDRVLHAACRRLGQRVRRSDGFGRWDDTTFLVIADADLGGAGALAEDLRTLLGSRPLDTAPRALRLTASIGVAAHRPGEPVADLVARAQAAVAAAGGDGVRLADALDAVTT